jgi:hypothetical protein
MNRMASNNTWRAREAAKEQYRREAANKAAEDAERKKYENTEDNFPTLVTTAHRMDSNSAPQGFSALAEKWREEDELDKKLEAYKKARTEKERREIVESIYVFRQTKRNQPVYEDEDEVVEETTKSTPLTVVYPGHGKRKTFSLPDSEGWRTVNKRYRKEKAELTEAELYEKYMNTRTNEEYDNEVNEDLGEGDQRRQFY